MEEILQKIADEVQAHLRLGAEHRATVELYVRRVAAQALTYCHREDLPETMQMLVAEMTEVRMRDEGAVPGISADAAVSSITRGDTSISYRDKTTAIKSMESFFADYRTRLLPFKRVNLPT